MTVSQRTEKILAHLPALAGIVRRGVLAAGDAVMNHYDESGFAGRVDLKDDQSPVTIADRQADQILRDYLAAEMPGIPMITEETIDQTDWTAVNAARYYWLIDGLDGTKAFRKGNPDFTVNVALIDGDTPVLGVVYAPAHGEGVVGVVGAGAVRFRTNPDRDDVVQVRAIPAQGLTVLASTSQPSPTSQAIIDRVKLNRFQQRHSSIKYLDIACGRADLMVAARDVYFWDSAAGDAALRAAGGMTLGLDGQPLRYNRDQPGLLHHGLVACGDTAYTVAVLAG